MAFFRSAGQSIATRIKLGFKNCEKRKVLAMARIMKSYEKSKVTAMTRINQFHEFVLQNLQIRPRLVLERQALLISRYGQFKECLGTGLHFTVPLVDRVMKTISMEEQYITIVNQLVLSDDNILNPEKAAFEVEDYHQATIELVHKALSDKYNTLKLIDGTNT
ncbi:hypothetical protein MtrunA17_Chr4g0057251 [Medicago truncatula]|uniref:SPFH domain/band 7 family protein n=1 Tax=Medicago truncatula TaxID=3880 RepID=A0A072UPS6_MEDTR|nr:SPFH domain/band 7 family protein [Medicago truncatula]RHN63342.1 hypothetical protein MtrunA17_Chr4g0057251 [Medicago truncatula]